MPSIHKKVPIVGFVKLFRGFTLIELMVTLIIAAILMTIAAPNLRDFILANKVSSQINDLAADLNFARTEAVKRNGTISACASGSQTSCDVSNWAAGRLVWVDTNGNKTIDAGEEILRVGTALTEIVLTASQFSDTDKIRFSASGAIDSTGKFKLCDAANKNGRELSIDATGKFTLIKVTCP